MEREQVKRIILYCTRIDDEISFSKKLLKECEDLHYSQTTTANYNGAINGKGGISTPVENIVLSVPEEVTLYMEELKRNIGELFVEKVEFHKALHSLEMNHKTILYKYYIQGYSWVKISVQTHYSESHCRRLRNSALDELGRQIEGRKQLLKVAEEKI